MFAQATLGDWRLALDAGWREKSLTNITPFYTYEYEVAASTQALRAKLISQWSGLSNDLVFGADAGRWERTVLGTFGSVANQKSIAFYVRDELTLPSKTKFSAGFRTESIRKSIVPSLPKRCSRVAGASCGRHGRLLAPVTQRRAANRERAPGIADRSPSGCRGS